MLRYFISKEFFLSILGIVAAGILLYLLIFLVILPAYTRHGEGVVVPDVYQKSMTEAEEILKEAGLNLQVRDSMYREDQPPLTVMSQYPKQFNRVKPGRTIFLTVNQIRPPMVALPDIENKTFFNARQSLESWKLKVGRVTRRPDIATDQKVLEVWYQGQPIEKETRVPQGSHIDLVIADGLRKTRVLIPDLKGYSFEEAMTQLRILGLGLGSVAYTLPPDEESLNRVYGQNPNSRYGDSVRVGTSIDLYIYGEAPELNEAPLMEVLDGDNR